MKPKLHALLLLGSFTFACSKASAPTEATESRTRAALEASGLSVQNLEDRKGLIPGADACQQGEIDGLDAAICEFSDETEAKAAESKGQAWIASARTGAAVASGRVLLVLADRNEADISGKRIDAIVKAFAKN